MFIDNYRNIFHINNMCMVLDVSKSSYYSWYKRGLSQREVSNKELIESIKAIHIKSKQRYGVLRITAELRSHGISWYNSSCEEKIQKDNRFSTQASGGREQGTNAV